jgi:PAS domain S-box-containing protein
MSWISDAELKFTPVTYQKSLLRAWETFIRTGDIESDVIRPAIASSWRRCRGFHLDPYEFSSSSYLDPALYIEHRKQYLYLLSISKPLMDNVYASLEHSRYLVCLYDPNGYHILRLGQVEDFHRSGEFSIREGLCFREEMIGTCGFSMVKELGEPIQIVGCEHYCARLHFIVGSYAPIYNPEDGAFMGVVSIAGAKTMPNHHTLGITIAMSTAIENMIKLDQSGKAFFIYGRALQMTIDSLGDGIVIVDMEGKIYELNQAAQQIFNQDREELKGRYLSEIKKMQKLDNLFKAVIREDPLLDDIEKEIDVKIQGQVYITTIKYVEEKKKHTQKGFMLQLKNLRTLSRIIQGRAFDQTKINFDTMIGTGPEMKSIKRIGRLAAKSDANIIIEGESGTGKEILARVIHNESMRVIKPFVIVNCTAIPSELMESTLFGHEKGAFTGAVSTHIGKFEQANEGTLFLDEITEMSTSMQAKLLRVIEEGTIERVGGKKPIHVNSRFIVATNRNLIEEIEGNRFRDDLFYRLNVFRIKLPPLRERKKDIFSLVQLYVNQFAMVFNRKIKKIDEDYYQALLQYNWPGNIRELRNAIQYSVALLEGVVLSETHLRGFFVQATSKTLQTLPVKGKKTGQDINILADLEDQAVSRALEAASGDKLKAAKLLGISRATIYRKLKKCNP